MATDLEMSNTAISYVIETEVPPNYIGNLMDYIYQKYLLPQKQRFANVARGIIDGYPSLTFNVIDLTGKKNMNVEIRGSKPIHLKILPFYETVPEKAINEVKQDVIIAVEFFEEKIRESTLYFAWREGEEIVPEKLHGKEKKAINRMFFETQIFLFVIFIGFGMFLFLIVGWLAPLILMAVQFVFVFYSNKIIARSGDWHITESNPTIHLLEYHLPVEEHDAFRKRFTKEQLMQMKKEVYERTISERGEIHCETAQQIFRGYGFECSPENLSTRKVDVYQLVKKVADRFGFPMPEIVVSNTMIPNAAASGPSPSRGIVLITTGLLVQLEEDEIVSVLGHEFGHLKGRDPLLLYGLTGAEFLFRFYVLFQLLPFIFFSYFFFIYFWIVMTVIYFIAKFFEARADLVSAIVIGQPGVLAKALEKIGFKRLLNERVPAFRVQEWISLEPHPPIYFRVNRLEKLEMPVKIKYPLIQSAKDVTNGFRASL
jgi:heat shock protein HtpX